MSDIDKSGYLQKKTSKGIWVNRFFATDRNYLRYWHTHTQHEVGEEAAESFDISEVKNIDTVGGKIFVLSFLAAGKFKVELSAGHDQERREWIGILEGKRRLYSVDELLADIREDRISFRTKSFQVLMMLHEREQNKWILDRIDEGFHISADETQAAKLRSDSSALLQASIRVVEEFIMVCRDCEEEISTRSPKIIAHSRNYIKRYCDILKGRLALELLYLPGITERQYELLGEKALCYCLELLHRLDITAQFTFVPREFSQALHRSLFTFGDVISSLLNLGMKRVDIFFEQLPSFAPIERCRKLHDGISLFVTSLLLVQHHLVTPELFRLVTQKLLSTQILAVVDHVQQFSATSSTNQYQYDETNSGSQPLSLMEYEESMLVQHIESMYHWQSATSAIYIDVEMRTIHHPTTLLRNQTYTIADLPASLALKTIQVPIDTNSGGDKNDRAYDNSNSANNSGNITRNDQDNTTTSTANSSNVIRVPSSELEAFRLACEDSARGAMYAAIYRCRCQRQQLVYSLFSEQVDGWLGGILVTAWLNNVQQWAMYIHTALPAFLQAKFVQEVCRMVLIMYWQRLLTFYEQYHPATSSVTKAFLGSSNNSNGNNHNSQHLQQHKKGNLFSDQGINQIIDDCQRIQTWIQCLLTFTNTSQSSSSSSSSSNTSVSLPEILILQIWQQYLQVQDQPQILPMFSDTLYQCGMPCVLYLYDTLRFFMKLRHPRINDSQRHDYLCLCEELIHQLLQQPGVKDDALFAGTFSPILDANKNNDIVQGTKSNVKKRSSTAMMGGYTYVLPIFEELCPNLYAKHVFCTGTKWKWLHHKVALTFLWSSPNLGSVSVNTLSSKPAGDSNNSSSKSNFAAGNSSKQNNNFATGNNSNVPILGSSASVTESQVLAVTLLVTELCNRALSHRRMLLSAADAKGSTNANANESNDDNVSKKSTASNNTSDAHSNILVTQDASSSSSTVPPPRPARRRSTVNPATTADNHSSTTMDGSVNTNTPVPMTETNEETSNTNQTNISDSGVTHNNTSSNGNSTNNNYTESNDPHSAHHHNHRTSVASHHSTAAGHVRPIPPPPPPPPATTTPTSATTVKMHTPIHPPEINSTDEKAAKDDVHSDTTLHQTTISNSNTTSTTNTTADTTCAIASSTTAKSNSNSSNNSVAQLFPSVDPPSGTNANNTSTTSDTSSNTANNNHSNNATTHLKNVSSPSTSSSFSSSTSSTSSTLPVPVSPPPPSWATALTSANTVRRSLAYQQQQPTIITSDTNTNSNSNSNTNANNTNNTTSTSDEATKITSTHHMATSNKSSNNDSNSNNSSSSSNSAGTLSSMPSSRGQRSTSIASTTTSSNPSDSLSSTAAPAVAAPSWFQKSLPVPVIAASSSTTSTKIDDTTGSNTLTTANTYYGDSSANDNSSSRMRRHTIVVATTRTPPPPPPPPTAASTKTTTVNNAANSVDTAVESKVNNNNDSDNSKDDYNLIHDTTNTNTNTNSSDSSDTSNRNDNTKMSIVHPTASSNHSTSTRTTVKEVDSSVKLPPSKPQRRASAAPALPTVHTTTSSTTTTAITTANTTANTTVHSNSNSSYDSNTNNNTNSTTMNSTLNNTATGVEEEEETMRKKKALRLLLSQAQQKVEKVIESASSSPTVPSEKEQQK